MRERRTKDCEDRQGGARGLATCRYDARRGTREAPAAAAATEAQTAAQTAALTAACAQAKVGAHTH